MLFTLNLRLLGSLMLLVAGAWCAFSVNDFPAGLPRPRGTPKFLALAFGTQHYTCQDGIWTPHGAQATLTAESLPKSPKSPRSTIPESDELNTHRKKTGGRRTGGRRTGGKRTGEKKTGGKRTGGKKTGGNNTGGTSNGERNNVGKNPGGRSDGKHRSTVGHHYFELPQQPTFQIYGLGTVVAEKKKAVPSPHPEKHGVPWLMLDVVQGNFARTVYRTSTVGGSPPSTRCKATDQPLKVPYSAIYSFWG
ncbi:hypothetical protein PGTUg99_020046 [Puccinia graminis f. sp. tritici]|uniref:Uncharacterized protein n=1 Tax=Puccinia graminis f. sp. tritici TaxID=56615 RepID=A0A5B0S0G7_PUCGR|nr:hypothetical protein PGTUg99_020046 [Puccinia graminis f. sp. tritici]